MDMDAPRQTMVHDAVDALIRTSRMHHHVVDLMTESDTLHRAKRRLLMHLCHFGDTASQRELARQMEVSPACVARMLKLLTDEGYITRTEDSTDTRRNNVRITPKGLSVINETRRTFEQLDLKCFNGLSADEILTLTSLLHRVHGNLKELEYECQK